MAYRVTTAPAKRARSAVPNRGDRSLSRNAIIAGAALTCICLTGAGVALIGRDHTVGSLPNYVASHKALKIAWVEPEQQAQFERNPNIAAAADIRPKTVAVEAPPHLARVARAEWIPLPHARPRKMMVAAIPLPRERVAQNATVAASAPKEQQEIAPAKPAMTLLSYAPATSEQLFAPEVTGSIGDPARELKAPHIRAMPKARPAPAHRTKTAHKPTPQEKLWGGPVRVASLTPVGTIPDSSDGIPRMPFDRQTAVYVISEKKVYMPDGAVLEAHSGLGDKMDDPRFVRVRMRGATPPHVYELKMRESLFHGVEAIRMLPIGGEDAIFGRDGILAHTYMLGPNGQSNGCVSFRDYDAFLDPFKAGKISRLAVIARLD
jgi:hypothetical protein